MLRQRGARLAPHLRASAHGLSRTVHRSAVSRYSTTKRQVHEASRKAENLHRKRSPWRWLVPTIVIVPLLYLTASQDTGVKEPRPAKPWQVKAYSTLPLKALSRVWGRFNDIELPLWMREPGFKLYAWMFGANLEEMKDPNLRNYRNLSEFFYRELKPGVRPIGDALLVCPSDGKVLQVGQLVGGQIEHVKGISYSLEAFIGVPKEAPHLHKASFTEGPREEGELERDEEFAQLNGISYTIDDIVGTENDSKVAKLGDATARSVAASSVASVSSSVRDLFLPDLTSSQDRNKLFYAVIYLAPGDYHRFHSPAAWVAQLRRHYVGELFSVAPYFQEKFTDLFCLNERVALLGRWKYGFFSMTPVGATNVGSIQINFDKYLKTNTRFVQDGENATRVRASKNNCYEATYASASPLLRGFPLQRGQEMGGFHLGSTVVLIFEAPESFKFAVERGQTVKMGQSMGTITT